MPIKIPSLLPATETLINENIFVMDESKADRQDIRPLKIALLNLMPMKIVTETQFLRLLSNTPIQIDITLLAMSSHVSKNTPQEHLLAFYKSFADIRNEKFDGLIITGAPVELLDFEQVDYWEELCEVMDWARHSVFSTVNVCWAAYAAFYREYGIEKIVLEKKISGVFRHKVLRPEHPLLRGFNPYFNAPHSRNTQVDEEKIGNISNLTILADSPEAGLYLACSKNGRQIYVTGHSEYDYDTLAKEYARDVAKGLNIAVPSGYFPDNDPTKEPINTWRAHAHLLYGNWVNFVYQETPYNMEEICYCPPE